MFAALGAVFFLVKLILDLIYPAGVTELMLDLGLLCVALALAFGPNFPITLRGRHV
jgi:hypothetical protein